ncbi:MAG: SDR family NAD(P)-dependent oxidoreductase [Candidatus Berkelbacteria bacterium]
MKTVVITGVSRGIGRATANKFLSEGWRVIGTSTSGQADYSHENLEVVQLDFLDSISIKSASEKIASLSPRIDALVNNAGVALDSWDEGVDMLKVRKTFEINLFGLIELTENLLPNITNGGRIVNLTSRYGSFSMPIDDNTSIGYRMAKASLNMYTRFLAFRLADHQIIVSAIHPGWTKTDMGFDGSTDEAKPDREPEEPAREIFDLATLDIESGQFWENGQKRDW